MIKISNIKVKENVNLFELKKIVEKKYNLTNVTEFKIIKKSVDARNKNNIFFNYAVALKCKNESRVKGATQFKQSKSLDIKVNRKSKYRPVVVGAGPAGLFSALILAKHNLKPILIEQGKTARERAKDVENFLKTGKLNTMSNVQFGEGGAGTFSDGKLTSGINDPLCKEVFELFYKFGAPEQILYLNKPHIGTDNLIKIVENMRNEIIKLGGDVFFETKLVDFEVENNNLKAIVCRRNDELIRIETDTLILAIGHSARDTFEMLYNKGLSMKKKNFSVGVRIEHTQEMINEAQYGKNPKVQLPPAEYKMAYHDEDRSCYTFCMCPGGEVIASSSEEETIVTNGMSKFARNGKNANSALLVNVGPEDFPGKSPLEGLYFQRNLEKSAYKLGGGNYFAPAQRFEDFELNRATKKFGSVTPTYKPGVTPCNLNEILPEYVSKTLIKGIKYFDKSIKGFANPDAVLTGVETRSSSPVQITRDENKVSNIKGIYPCGEGAGYAGGITSSAVDGIKCAIEVISKK